MHKLKWVALILVALAVIVVIMTVFARSYDLDIDVLKGKFKWAQAASSQRIDFAHDRLYEVAKEFLSRGKLLYNKHTTRIRVKRVEDDQMVLDHETEVEVKNTGDSRATYQLDISTRVAWPRQEVRMGTTTLNPTKVTPSGANEEVLQYEVEVPAGEAKTLVFIRPDLKESFPFEHLVAARRPVLQLEIFVEGPPDVLGDLKVSASALTWKDNWEETHPQRQGWKVYGWRNTRYAMLPFQGAILMIEKKKN